MKRIVIVAMVAMTLVGGHAKAQTVKNGGPHGKVMTASTNAPTGLSIPISVTLESPSYHFVITQVCVNQPNCFVIGGGGPGMISASAVHGSPEDRCITYSPGIIQGTSWNCDNSISPFGNCLCRVTGVQVKK